MYKQDSPLIKFFPSLCNRLKKDLAKKKAEFSAKKETLLTEDLSSSSSARKVSVKCGLNL